MEHPSPAVPCAHLQALLAGPNAASIIDGWDDWGVVRVLSNESDSDLAAHTPGLARRDHGRPHQRLCLRLALPGARPGTRLGEGPYTPQRGQPALPDRCAPP